jgi:hypothetical protein
MVARVYLRLRIVTAQQDADEGEERQEAEHGCDEHRAYLRTIVRWSTIVDLMRIIA